MGGLRPGFTDAARGTDTLGSTDLKLDSRNMNTDRLLEQSLVTVHSVETTENRQVQEI